MELNAQAQLAPPRIEDYEDYRAFLSDFHNFKKSSHSSWSYRMFAARSGIASAQLPAIGYAGEEKLK